VGNDAAALGKGFLTFKKINIFFFRDLELFTEYIVLGM